MNLNDKAPTVSCFESPEEIQFVRNDFDPRTYTYTFTLVDEPQVVKQLVEEKDKLVVKSERYVSEYFADGGYCSKNLLLIDHILYDQQSLFQTIDRDQKKEGLNNSLYMGLDFNLAPKFPLQSGGRLFFLGSSWSNQDINSGLVMPLLNSTTLNNSTTSNYSLFNEFFFYHDETKIVQIRTCYGEKAKLFIKDLVGNILQELATSKCLRSHIL